MVSSLNGTFNSALKLCYLSTWTFSSILWWLLQSSLSFRFPNPPPHYSFLSYSSKKIGDKITETPQTPLSHLWTFLNSTNIILFVLLWTISLFTTMAPPSPAFHLLPLQGSCSIRHFSHHPILQIPFFSLTHSYQHLKYWFFLFSGNLFSFHTYP